MQVLDSLITSLAKHTSILNPAMPQASIAFGADELSCMATETMFELANRCATAQRAAQYPLLCLDVSICLHATMTHVDHHARSMVSTGSDIFVRNVIYTRILAMPFRVDSHLRPHMRVCWGAVGCEAVLCK